MQKNYTTNIPYEFVHDFFLFYIISCIITRGLYNIFIFRKKGLLKELKTIVKRIISKYEIIFSRTSR